MRGKSLNIALHDAVGIIEKGLYNELYALAAFLDTEGTLRMRTTKRIRFSLAPGLKR